MFSSYQMYVINGRSLFIWVLTPLQNRLSESTLHLSFVLFQSTSNSTQHNYIITTEILFNRVTLNHCVTS